MVPQGFDAHECSEATAVPVIQLRKRAREINLAFGSEANFGPQSKCGEGHYYQDEGVGWKMVTNSSGKKTRRCNLCYRDSVKRSNAKRNAKRRNERAAKRKASGKPKVIKPAKRQTISPADIHYKRCMATNAIIALHEEKDRCSTHWERAKIQDQIDQLAKRITD